MSYATLNNSGVLGRNEIACSDHLTSEDRKNLEGFMLSAFELKEELRSKQAAPKQNADGSLRKPREPKATPNTYLHLFRRVSSYDNMSSIVEDLFMGAIRQQTTGSYINARQVFAMMKSLPVISTEGCYVSCNQRRVASEIMGQRYAQQLAMACRNVIKVFDHYEEVITKFSKMLDERIDTLDADFDAVEDSQMYELDKLTRPTQTTQQRIELLRQAGLTETEITRYESGLPLGSRCRVVVSHGSAIRIKTGQIMTSYSKRLPEHLEWLPMLCAYVDTSTGELLDCY